MVQVEHIEAGHDQFVSALETHETKCTYSFGLGDVSIVDYSWNHPTSDTWYSEDYYLNMALGRRSGPGLATYVDGKVRVSENIGRTMVVPPGYTVRSSSSRGRQRTILCALRPQAVHDLVTRRPVWNRKALSDGLHLNSPELEWFLLKIQDELIRPSFAQQVMIDSLANGLAVALVRAFNLQGDADGPSNSGGLSTRRMRLIRDRIASDQPMPQLLELADLCGISVRHLTRAFRTETNITIAKYIESMMVERARSMLELSDSPIGQVARDLGFSSTSSFTYAFRRATGKLPSAVRRAAH